MNVVTEFSDEIAQWVSAQIPGMSIEDFGFFSAVGFTRDNEPIAGAVFSDYRPEYGDIELTLATNGSVRAVRQGVSVGLTYAFKQLAVQRITVRCRSKNARARKFAEGTGFVLEGVIRRGYGDDDMCIYGLLIEDAQRWINHGSA